MLSSCRSNYSCWFHVGTLLLLLCVILSCRRRHHRYSLPRRRGPTESSPNLAHVQGLVKSVRAMPCIKATTRAPVRCLLFSLSHEKAGLPLPFLGNERAGDGGTWTAVTGALHMHPKCCGQGAHSQPLPGQVSTPVRQVSIIAAPRLRLM
jgi:hypothetical protein